MTGMLFPRRPEGRSPRRFWLLLVAVGVLFSTDVQAQAFQEQANTAGVRFTHDAGPWPGSDMPIGAGAAWADFDNDGDLDLYVTQRGGANRLYLNDGSGNFTDNANALGVADASNDGTGVAVADFDNDGDRDIYLANGSADVFFRNDLIENGGTLGFTDITATSGIDPDGQYRGQSASWGDYNNDGFLDLYIANHMSMTGGSSRDFLYLNDGDGTFTDVSTLLAGDVDADGTDDRDGFGFIAAFTDFDNDGDADIYLMNDCPFGPEDNKLWRNDGGTNAVSDWTFTEVSDQVGPFGGGKDEDPGDGDVTDDVVFDCQNAMGIAWADYDHNGTQDYFYTNLGNNLQPSTATLLQNDGGSGGTYFTNVESSAGVEQFFVPGTPRHRVTWGAVFFDYNLDSFSDLVVAAGGMDDPSSANAQPNMLFENNGDGTFADISTTSGLNNPRRGRSIVMGDYDGDGDPDLYEVNIGEPTALYENLTIDGADDNTANNWLIVDLVGTTSNRDGIGAKVRARTMDGVEQVYEMRSGSSVGGGDDIAAYFGFDTELIVETLTIEWPSGIVQTINNVAIDQRITVTEAATDFLFADVAEQAGVLVTHDAQQSIDGGDMGIGTGAAWLDYDGDGDLDVYMTQRNGANLLFSNNGDGTFTEVAAAAGVQDASHDGAGVAAADYDNDGDRDLYLANSDSDVLFRNNGDGTFTDVTVAAFGSMPLAELRGTSASWGDYDNDGFLDLYVANHMSMTGGANNDLFYRNNGDGTFTDVSALLMGDADSDGTDDLNGLGFIAGFTDYDDDGDLDVFLMNDCPLGPEGNKLWRNDGLSGSDPATDWTFTEVATAENADQCRNAMGLAWGDYDGDQLFDYFFTNAGANVNGGLPVLLQNETDGAAGFNNATVAAGVDELTVPETGLNRVSWGAIFFDYDLDALQDLYVATGLMNPASNVSPQPNILYQNNGDGTFTDVSDQSGADDPRRAKTPIMGDYDGDGDPDIFLVNNGEETLLLQNNNANGNNWLIVDLVGTQSNRDGIGAKVIATTAGGTQTYEVRSGSSLGGGDDIAAYFGLGTDATVNDLTVEWPSGTTQTLTSVAANQRLTVTEEISVTGPFYANSTTATGTALLHDAGPWPGSDMAIGTGAAWFDYDDDGDLDLYVTQRGGANRLFQNDGAGSFTDVAASVGADDAAHDGAGVAAADFDNDGDLDLYLANADEDILLRNDLVENGGTPGFTDITATSGIDAGADQRGTSASWGDYDGDGFLDLYVANHMPLGGVGRVQDHLYYNNGDGTFTNASALLMGDVDADGTDDLDGFGFIAAFTDFDGDGDADIYLMNDCPFGAEDNKLWRNDGLSGSDPATDWVFTEVSDLVGPFDGGKDEDPGDGDLTDDVVFDCQNAMGIAWADYDHNGTQDYFYTNLGNNIQPGTATLLQNDGGSGGTYFTNVESSAGVEEFVVPGTSRPRITWGAVFTDFDLDGYQDLAVAAGTMDEPSSLDPQPNMLYHNNGDGTFDAVPQGTDFFQNSRRTRTVVMGDYDGDGDPDLYTVNIGEAAALYENTFADTFGNNWLIVDLIGTTSNRNGIGAKVIARTVDGMEQVYEIRSGSSLGGGDDMAAYFGLGKNPTATSLTVEWPSGIVQEVGSVDANQRLTVTESAPLPVELTTFEGRLDNQDVLLTWATASETNNAGFEVQQRIDGRFQKVGFVEGVGTTIEGQQYSYRASSLEAGTQTFRLKQVDFDGVFAYSPEVEVSVELPGPYELTSAYPNPFNPQTQFALTVQRQQRVQVAVYDVLGRRVALLYNGQMPANEKQSFRFDASTFASGVYLIQAHGEHFTATQKVMLVK